jgi:hypothetical protein
MSSVLLRVSGPTHRSKPRYRTDEPRDLGAAGIKQDKVDHSRSRYTKGKDRNPCPLRKPQSS